MLVQEWMSKNVITIDINDSMNTATQLLKENNIKMLPVLEKGNLKGIITDRDLKRASASDANSLEIHELLFLLSTLKVESIMSRPAITVFANQTMEETAEILLENKISGAAVLDNNGELAGIITQTDIFKAFISLSGIRERGVLIALQLSDKPGSIMEVTNIIRKFDGRMISILSSYNNVKDGFRKVYLRMFGIPKERLQELQKVLEEKAKVLYIVDHRKI